MDVSFARSPQSSSITAEATAETSLWTPSCWTSISSDSDDDAAGFSAIEEPVLSTYNKALDDLSKLSDCETPCRPLEFQLNGSLENASRVKKADCLARATEACKLVCNVIAPDDGESLFNSLPRKEEAPEQIRLLINAFAQAPTRNLKTQILRIYAYEYSAKKLQNLHEPYAKLTKWQIKRVRAHARRNSPGFAVTKPKHHRISLDMNKVDHFVDFISCPYFHQDVAFGTR